MKKINLFLIIFYILLVTIIITYGEGFQFNSDKISKDKKEIINIENNKTTEKTIENNKNIPNDYKINSDENVLRILILKNQLILLKNENIQLNTKVEKLEKCVENNKKIIQNIYKLFGKMSDKQKEIELKLNTIKK